MKPNSLPAALTLRANRIWGERDSHCQHGVKHAATCAIAPLSPSQDCSNLAEVEDSEELPLYLMQEEVWLLCQKGLALLHDNSRMLGSLRSPRHNFTPKASAAALGFPLGSLASLSQTLPQSSSSSPSSVSSFLGSPVVRADRSLSNDSQRHHCDPIAYEDNSVDSEDAFVASSSHHALFERLRASVTNSLRAQLRCLVYFDLWKRGYFVTQGLAYGCDFLVYSGSPSRFHSHFQAFVNPFHELFSTNSLVCAARVGSSARKYVLLCSAVRHEDSLSSGFLSCESSVFIGKLDLPPFCEAFQVQTSSLFDSSSSSSGGAGNEVVVYLTLDWDASATDSDPMGAGVRQGRRTRRKANRARSSISQEKLQR